VHGVLPTGYAGTLLAGWVKDPTPLTHVRVTVSDLVINNALQLATPVAPKTCSTSHGPCSTSADCSSGESCLGAGPVKSWVMQAAINGEWQELSGLDVVNTGDVIPQTLVYDQYLAARVETARRARRSPAWSTTTARPGRCARRRAAPSPCATGSSDCRKRRGSGNMLFAAASGPALVPFGPVAPRRAPGLPVSAGAAA